MIEQAAREAAAPPAPLPAPASEFARFLAVGTVAAAVNLGSRYLLNTLMGYSAAILLAYLCGMITAFVLSKWFVFGASRLGAATEFIRFTLVNVVAVIQVWAISIFLGDWLFPGLGFVSHAHDVAHLIGVGVPVVTSYLGHKHFSFASR